MTTSLWQNSIKRSTLKNFPWCRVWDFVTKNRQQANNCIGAMPCCICILLSKPKNAIFEAHDVWFRYHVIFEPHDEDFCKNLRDSSQTTNYQTIRSSHSTKKKEEEEFSMRNTFGETERTCTSDIRGVQTCPSRNCLGNATCKQKIGAALLMTRAFLYVRPDIIWFDVLLLTTLTNNYR